MSESATTEDPADMDADTLTVRLEMLREENERLRREFSRARLNRYRRAAIGLAAIGAVTAAAGVVFPGQRPVLFALGATGLFAAVLTAYLTPERFVSASVGERIYDAQSASIEELANTLGLSTTRVYMPIDDPQAPDGRTVRLFVPQWETYELPTHEDLRGILVSPDDEARRGLSVMSTGDALLREVPDVEAQGDEPVAITLDRLVETLVETFELVDGAEPDVDADRGRATVSVAESVYGDATRFDHPVPSFIGAGLASTLDRPVEVAVKHGDERVHCYVQCDWDRPGGAGD